MNLYDQLNIEEFLLSGDWRLVPCATSELAIEGRFELDAEMHGFARVHETYDLRIVVRDRKPEPKILVYEPKGKIPKSIEYHINADGSFCLGAPLKLLSLARPRDGLLNYFDKCVIPYLYKITHLIKYREIPDELAHFTRGLVDQYSDLFGVAGIEATYRTLLALSLNHRRANKVGCPCECGRRLGSCDYRWYLKRHWRHKLPRSAYRSEAKQVYEELKIVRDAAKQKKEIGPPLNKSNKIFSPKGNLQNTRKPHGV